MFSSTLPDSDRNWRYLGRNWIEFSATVGELEELLHTEYHNYQHKQSGGYRIACDEYKIPQHVRQHVDFITPTIQLEGLRPVARATPAIAPPATNNDDYTMGEPDDLARCQSFMSIHCLRALYNIPLADRNNTGNELGIYASWDHLYAPDLPVYYKNWTSPQIPSDVEPEFISIYGGKRGTQSMAEANRASESALDIQTTQSIIYPQKVRLYQVGASEYISSFNIFLDALVSIMSHSA
jgi:tripeptidyl-peptidase-1